MIFIFNIIFSFLLIGFLAWLSYKNKHWMMVTTTAAFGIILAFLNIEKIQRFKGAGFEAEMRNVVNDANATLDQLKKVSVASSRVLVSQLMTNSFLFEEEMKDRLAQQESIIQNLKDIGATKEDLSYVLQPWVKGVGVIYFRGIKSRLEELYKGKGESENEKSRFRKILNDYQNQLTFEEWDAPTPEENRVFMSERNIDDQVINELIIDYEYYLNTGEYRRREVFMRL